jgi:hypothetical protein
MPGVSGMAFRSIGRVCSFPKSGANRERLRCNAMISNGGGQGARSQQQRTSSRWMPCNRHFPSKPGRAAALQGNERDAIKHHAGGTVGSTPLLPRRYQIDVGRGPVRRVAGRNELQLCRQAEEHRKRCGTNACLRKRAMAPRQRLQTPSCQPRNARQYSRSARRGISFVSQIHTPPPNRVFARHHRAAVPGRLLRVNCVVRPVYLVCVATSMQMELYLLTYCGQRWSIRSGHSQSRDQRGSDTGRRNHGDTDRQPSPRAEELSEGDYVVV